MQSSRDLMRTSVATVWSRFIVAISIYLMFICELFCAARVIKEIFLTADLDDSLVFPDLKIW